MCVPILCYIKVFSLYLSFQLVGTPAFPRRSNHVITNCLSHFITRLLCHVCKLRLTSYSPVLIITRKLNMPCDVNKSENRNYFFICITQCWTSTRYSILHLEIVASSLQTNASFHFSQLGKKSSASLSGYLLRLILNIENST